MIMMDKNHSNGKMASYTPQSFMRQLTAPLNIILCTDATKKTRLLGLLSDLAPNRVLYVDTDMLYAGCVHAGLYNNKDHITIYCPDQNTWHRTITDIICQVSISKTVVIIDSLNGVYEMFGKSDSAMSANAHIMSITSLARQAGSSVIMGAMVRRKNNRRKTDNDTSQHDHTNDSTCRTSIEEYILSPSGRQIPKIAQNHTLFLEGTRLNPLLCNIL